MKQIKFTPKLTQHIIDGKKTTTFRLFDDKDLQVGDEFEMATRDGETVTAFGKAVITEIMLRTVATIQPSDYSGHEPVTAEDDVLASYRKYYGDKVTWDTPVKVIRFKVLELQ